MQLCRQPHPPYRGTGQALPFSSNEEKGSYPTPLLNQGEGRVRFGGKVTKLRLDETKRHCRTQLFVRSQKFKVSAVIVAVYSEIVHY